MRGDRNTAEAPHRRAHREHGAMTGPLAALLSVACAIAVANVYYAQPLLGPIGAGLRIGPTGLGLVTGLTQAGYLLGLVLVVPLGDLVNRRVLIVVQSLVAAAALVAVAAAQNAWTFFLASAVVGAASVVVQVIIAYAAVLSDPANRGRVVGLVTSGVVVGILLARTVSGLLADAFGWRSVYLASAALMTTTALALARLLPADTVARAPVSYRRLASSVFTLTARLPVFRVRSLISLFMFGAFGALWGSLALPLTEAPWRLSASQVGLFGLAGAAGAVGAARAGTLADRGLAQRVTGVTLVLYAASWPLIAALGHSLVPLIIGVTLLNLAGQAIHVTNQQLIVAIEPAASSRLVGSYMVYYSVGSGGGAIAATAVYSVAGWPGVCLLGFALSTLALLVWLTDHLTHTRRTQP
jgi:predicted MFS family arabinose efflux permease